MAVRFLLTSGAFWLLASYSACCLVLVGNVAMWQHSVVPHTRTLLAKLAVAGIVVFIPGISLWRLPITSGDYKGELLYSDSNVIDFTSKFRLRIPRIYNLVSIISYPVWRLEPGD